MPHRQHLRVHRPGREESVQTILELAKLKDAGACRRAHRHRLPDPALRRRDPEGDARDRRHPRHLRASPASSTSCARPANRHDWATAAPPGYLYDAAAPRAAHRRGAVRVREDRRGLRHGLHLLRDPPVPRPPPQPPARRHRRRGGGARRARRAGGDPRLPGHARLRPGPARATVDIGDLLLALSDTRDAVDPPMYLHPAHVNDRLVAKWAARARSRTSTCRSSTATTAC